MQALASCFLRRSALMVLCLAAAACGGSGDESSQPARAEAVVNTPPQLATLPALSLTLLESIQHSLQALDAEGDPLRYSATGLPSGVSLDPASGVISGRPTESGSFTVSVSVSDGVHAREQRALWQVSAQSSESNLSEGADLSHDRRFYALDNYWPLSVVRLDVQTHAQAGPCQVGDYQGCKLDDVLADIDSRDRFKPRLAVGVDTLEYPASQSGPNAELKLRGFSTRTAAQKSFSIKLDSKDVLWRQERRLQLNKHPFDTSRMRNKLAFDLLSEVPNLPSARTQFVRLWLRDGNQPSLDQGLYTHVEYFGKAYLVNRGWDKDSGLYKAEFFNFSNADKNLMQLNAEGEPVDPDLFESRLEIKRGEQHQALLAMIEAVNEQADFAAVMQRYFDQDNFITWLAANLLLGHQDLGSHNYYLYNPKDTERFFFLPWDFDGALNPFDPLEPGQDQANLRQRMGWGYANFQDNVMVRRALQLPGMHQQVLAKAAELRQGPLSDQRINTLVDQYIPLVRPVVMSEPDLPHVPRLRRLANAAAWDQHVAELKTVVAANHQRLQNDFDMPLSPYAKRPEREGDQWVLWWNPAISITGERLSYSVEVAKDPSFSRLVYQRENIDDTEQSSQRVEHRVPASRFAKGTYYYRVFAHVARDPERVWQVSNNTGVADSLGARAFNIP